jgi:alpha-tubulin suppressor-like RCC1 family protein
VTVAGLSGATALTVGYDGACAIVAGGAMTCWGADYWGSLGDGRLTRPTGTLASVVGVAGATAASMGNQHTCALAAGGAAMCWGFGGAGELGNGRKTSVGALRVAW